LLSPAGNQACTFRETEPSYFPPLRPIGERLLDQAADGF
jgi:hypothetical protein